MLQTHAGSSPDSPPYPGAPRWAKAFGITAGLIVILLLIMKLVLGSHGSGKHAPSGDVNAPAMEHGAQQP